MTRRFPLFFLYILGAAVAAGNVDAAHRGIYLEGRKAEVIALQSASAVSTFVASSFQKKIKKRFQLL